MAIFCERFPKDELSVRWDRKIADEITSKASKFISSSSLQHVSSAEGSTWVNERIHTSRDGESCWVASVKRPFLPFVSSCSQWVPDAIRECIPLSSSLCLLFILSSCLSLSLVVMCIINTQIRCSFSQMKCTVSLEWSLVDTKCLLRDARDVNKKYTWLDFDLECVREERKEDHLHFAFLLLLPSALSLSLSIAFARLSRSLLAYTSESALGKLAFYFTCVIQWNASAASDRERGERRRKSHLTMHQASWKWDHTDFSPLGAASGHEMCLLSKENVHFMQQTALAAPYFCSSHSLLFSSLASSPALCPRP